MGREPWLHGQYLENISITITIQTLSEQFSGAPLNPLISSINTVGSQGTSNNNMMLAGLKHQFSQTFSLDAQYSFGP